MLEKLEKIFRVYTGDEIVLSKEQSLVTDLALNSLDLMNLVSEIEEEFDVEISDRELYSFKTVGDVVDYIENK